MGSNSFLCALQEYLKPIVYGEDEDAKKVPRNVLYTCLDNGLRLLSPFMPFLTEELFQRLPDRTPDVPPSICVSPYPEKLNFRDELLDVKVKLMQEVVRTIRSMRQDYLPPKAKPEVYVVCKTDEASATLHEFEGVMATLGQCSKLHILTQEPLPSGCTMATVGHNCEVHLMLRGMVDTKKEIGKLEEKIAKINLQLENLDGMKSMEGYEEKVPVEVRDANLLKEKALRAERGNLQRALEGFRSLQELTGAVDKLVCTLLP